VDLDGSSLYWLGLRVSGLYCCAEADLAFHP